MIGRLKGILIHKRPPWVKRRAREALPRAPLNARPGMAGQGAPEACVSRQGWLPLSTVRGRLM
jgi:hypothetical protein